MVRKTLAKKGTLGVRWAVVCLLLVVCALASTTTTAHGLPRSFYGVIPQGPLSASDYQKMREARVGTVRVLVGWDQSLEGRPQSGRSRYGTLAPQGGLASTPPRGGARLR